MKITRHHCDTVLLASMFVVFSACSAYAQAMQDAICYVAQLIWGPMGTAMGIIAVSSVAAAATMGKASWGMALTVCTGIAVMFGAAELAQILGVGLAGYTAGAGNEMTWCPDNL